MTHAETTQRPGGRSARVREAVHQAVLEVVIDEGVDKVGIPEISRRAGVRNSSVYRRWGTRENLLVDALLTASERTLPVPDTGSLHGDLSTFASNLIAYLDTPLGDGLARTLASISDSEETRSAREAFWAGRLQAVLPMITRAIERGELPPDTDGRTLIELVIAPIHFRHLLTREHLDHAFASSLAAAAVQAVRTVPSVSPPG
ncbi:MAG: TetR/AcrR family transcriptional regulator [Gordonia sp. (in: high G+C Gram-positive bacteria)]|uniref:TetR/AcrR family transcriptional regulator n=1 Tax=Gordonia sp. (in: high G+C Gram-positive bacteria) TaxID=84139 RepID=UPI0039E4AF18